MTAVQSFALALFFIALGALARFHLRSPEVWAMRLNQLVLWVFLPAAVLRHAPDLTRGDEAWVLALTPWVLMTVTAIVVALIARWRGWQREQLAVALICFPLGNTAFLGYPLVRALAGESALPFAVVYDQLGSFLIFAAVAVFLQQWFSTQGALPWRWTNTRAMLLRIVGFPAFIALVLALWVLPSSVLRPLHAPLTLLSFALMPCACIAIGLQLQWRVPVDDREVLAIGLGWKLLAMPGLALWAARWFELSPDASHALVFESGMPTMMVAAALCANANLKPNLANALVVMGIVLSSVSLFFWSQVMSLLIA